MFVALKRLHPTDVDIPEIKGFLTIFHPLRQSLPRTAGGLNTNRIEAGSYPNIIHLRRQAKMIGVIGGKTLRSVEKRVDSRRTQHWHARYCLFQNWLKMVEIFWQLIKFKINRNAFHGPRF